MDRYVDVILNWKKRKKTGFWAYDHPSNKNLKDWLLTEDHVRKDGVREQSRVSED